MINFKLEIGRGCSGIRVKRGLAGSFNTLFNVARFNPSQAPLLKESDIVNLLQR